MIWKCPIVQVVNLEETLNSLVTEGWTIYSISEPFRTPVEIKKAASYNERVDPMCCLVIANRNQFPSENLPDYVSYVAMNEKNQ